MAEISQREAYGRALVACGETHPDVVVLDADTSSSTLSCYFAARFPKRFFNLGIAEPCMVDVAVGLALGGLTPFANAFAALISLRALEQVRTCVCYARTNVKLVAGYAGLSDYKDGPTHHAIKDVALMRAMPGMTVVIPADAAEVAAWVPVITEYDGPVYFRLSRASTLPVHYQGFRVEIGKGEILRPGADATILATGAMAGRSLLAAQALEAQGMDVRVINLSTIKPLDAELVMAAAEETEAIVTAEEHSIVGGLGSAVAELMSENCPTPLVRVGVADTFARTAPNPESLMDAFGLSIEDITRAVLKAVGKKKY